MYIKETVIDVVISVVTFVLAVISVVTFVFAASGTQLHYDADKELSCGHVQAVVVNTEDAGAPGR